MRFLGIVYVATCPEKRLAILNENFLAVLADQASNFFLLSVLSMSHRSPCNDQDRRNDQDRQRHDGDNRTDSYAEKLSAGSHFSYLVLFTMRAQYA